VRLSLRAIVVALVIAAAGSALAQETPAVRTLATYGPDILWQPESELSGDIDCDGRPDQALLGRRDDRVYVGVVVSSKPRPEILGFTAGGTVHDAICPEPPVLKIESLDYDPKKTIGRLDGFRRSKRCKGLRLSSGSCSSLRFFWNHKTDELDWWRL
jgi:hypothetical protein